MYKQIQEKREKTTVGLLSLMLFFFSKITINTTDSTTPRV